MNKRAEQHGEEYLLRRSGCWPGPEFHGDGTYVRIDEHNSQNTGLSKSVQNHSFRDHSARSSNSTQSWPSAPGANCAFPAAVGFTSPPVIRLPLTGSNLVTRYFKLDARRPTTRGRGSRA